MEPSERWMKYRHHKNSLAVSLRYPRCNLPAGQWHPCPRRSAWHHPPMESHGMNNGMTLVGCHRDVMGNHHLIADIEKTGFLPILIWEINHEWTWLNSYLNHQSHQRLHQNGNFHRDTDFLRLTKKPSARCWTWFHHHFPMSFIDTQNLISLVIPPSISLQYRPCFYQRGHVTCRLCTSTRFWPIMTLSDHRSIEYYYIILYPVFSYPTNIHVHPIHNGTSWM